jgi:beta-glucosidase-like glycosyl hydrolase
MQANAQGAVEAGLDMELPWAHNYEHLESLVQAGTLPETALNTAVQRILYTKFQYNVAAMSGRLGLKARPTRRARGRPQAVAPR